MATYVRPIQPWLDEINAMFANSSEAFTQSIVEDTIRDFCQESLAWRGVTAGQTIFSGDRIVALNPAAYDRKIIHVFRVKVSDQQLSPAEFVDSSETGASVWFSAFGDDPSEIKLEKIPDTTQSSVLTALVAYAPIDLDDYLPEVIVTTHYSAIRAGALGRLYGQVHMPYSDEKQHMLNTRKYRTEVARARIRANAGHTTGAYSWSFPRFA
jgi:hypothetical protein